MAGLSLLPLQPSERKRVDSNYESSVTSLLTEDSLGNIVQAFLSVDLIRPDLLLWLVHFTGYFDYYGLVHVVSELSSCRNKPKDDFSIYTDVLATNFAGNIVRCTKFDRHDHFLRILNFCC